MKTVLIVDDEKLFLASLTEGLLAYADEFSVVTAENGRQAVEILKAQEVDLVITDLKMPMMDGFQLLAHMMMLHSDIPVIVMTAFGTPEIEDQIKSLAAFDYLEKPIDFETLADKISRALGGGGDAATLISGFTLASLLQLIHLERKTCSLTIKSGERTGTLNFYEGELFDAACENLAGEAAALKIINWETPQIGISHIFKKVHRSLETPLNQLLTEAAQSNNRASASAAELEASFQAMMSSQPLLDSDPLEISDQQQALLPDETRADSPNDASPIDSDVAEHQILDIIPLNPLTVNTSNLNNLEKELIMPNNVNQSMQELMQIDGAMAVALVDTKSGMLLGSAGGGLNLDVAAAGNSEVVKSKLKVMTNLGLKDTIEDILITLGSQYHLIRPLNRQQTLFIYLVLNRAQSNLAMARHKLSDIESRVEV